MSGVLIKLPHATLNAIQTPFVIKNRYGVVLSYNQAFHDLNNLGTASILGLTDYDFLSCKEADIHARADSSLLAATDRHYIDYRITRDGPDGMPLNLSVHKSLTHLADGAIKILEVVNTIIAPCGARNNYLLSPRETGVLELLVQGYSQKQIANTLSISSYTVNDHLKAIYTKLGVSSRTQAQLKAIVELGMVKESANGIKVAGTTHVRGRG